MKKFVLISLLSLLSVDAFATLAACCTEKKGCQKDWTCTKAGCCAFVQNPNGANGTVNTCGTVNSGTGCYMLRVHSPSILDPSSIGQQNHTKGP